MTTTCYLLRRSKVLAASYALVWFAGCTVVAAAPPNFQEDVLPIFRQHCVGCHNADDPEVGLDLSSSRGVMTGSTGGSVVIAGRPDSSPLFLAVEHHESYSAMPPNKPKLAEATRQTIREWIAQGLVDAPGGASKLRGLNFDMRVGDVERPKERPFPKDLPVVSVHRTARKPAIVAMACSPWSELVAVAGHRQVLLYGVEDGRREWSHLGTLPFPSGDVQDLRFSRDGSLLTVAGGVGAVSGHVVIHDVVSGERLATLADEVDVVLTADISANHEWVAIGTPKKLVKVFSTRSGELLHRMDKHTDWVTVARFSPDGKYLATADRNGSVYVWDGESGGVVYSLDEHKVSVTALAWRADGRVLASGAEDGKFVLWDMKDGWAARSIVAHAEEAPTRYTRRTGVLDIAFARDGRLVTVGRDRVARLWNPDGTPQARFDCDELPLQACFAGSETIAVGGMAGQLQLLQTPDLVRQAVLGADSTEAND